MPPNIILEPTQPANDMNLHRELGELQSGRDFLLRQTLDFSQHNHFAQPGRQPVDGTHQHLQFVSRAGRLGGVGPVVAEGKGRNIRHCSNRRHPLAAHPIDRDAPRHLEEKRL